MQKLYITRGCVASGKSTWAIEQLKKDPNIKRINRDSIRLMLDNSVWSAQNEKLVVKVRNFIIQEALRSGSDVIVDDTNIASRNWTDICKIVSGLNLDVQVIEKLFYEEIEVLLERNAKREGAARVPDDVVKKFYKDLGGKQFRFSNAKVETFTKRSKAADRFVEPMVQDESLPRAVIFDNDGTISLIHSGRSPYDASTCNLDAPHPHVIECMKLYHDAGYKILFVSGRENKDRVPTEKFYQQYFPEVKYELYMRPTGDQRKDVIIKEEIFNEHIKGKYFVAGWFDDRLQVSKWVYNSGLPLFRVNDPEANF